MATFAHLADCHLGYQKSPGMQRVEEEAFKGAITACIDRNVDFVLLCGDIFHTNIPSMGVQKTALGEFRRLHDAGIPAYCIYGSHDFSPVSNSFIDLLVKVEYLRKLTYRSEEGRIIPDIMVHEPTGTSLAGLPGLKSGRDRELYGSLDRDVLPEGPRIWLFHGAIEELAGQDRGGSMAASMLPAGWDYYAGGHMHDHMVRNIPGLGTVAYPGTLLAGYHADMENAARGTKRGFLLVSGEKNPTVEFVGVRGCDCELFRLDADGRTAGEIDAELQGLAAGEHAGKAVIFRVGGEMSSGRLSNIDFAAARRAALKSGALSVDVRITGLRTPESRPRPESTGSSEEIESAVLADAVASVRIGRPELDGERGMQTAASLLEALRRPMPENGTKSDYEETMKGEVYGRLDL